MVTLGPTSLTLLALLFATGIAAAQSPLAYSTYLGGIGSESNLRVATDASGNTYVAGNTTSLGPPFTTEELGFFSSVQRTFVWKMDPSGRLAFSKIITVQFGAMAVDPEGNVYLAGRASWPDRLPTTAGSFQVTANGGGAFVMKLDSEGQTVFSTYFGNNTLATATTVTFDPERNVVFCGNTPRARDIPLTDDAIQKTAEGPGLQVGFCAVLSADGSQLRFSTLLGGSGLTFPLDALVEKSGDLTVVGTTASSDFPLVKAFQTEDRRRSLYRFHRTDETWSEVGDSSLGSVASIGFGATADQMFLGSEGGFQVSNDGGASWQRLPMAGRALVVHPRNPRYLCAVSSGFQLSCSSDGGQQWQWTPTTSQVQQVVADPKVLGGFYVLGSELRYVSLAGAGGPRVPALPFVRSIAVDASGENTTIWAIHASLLLRWRTGESQFEVIGDNISRVYTSQGVLYGTRAGRMPGGPWLARSTDAGSTWTDIVTDFEPGDVRALVIDPRTPSTLFLASRSVAPWGVYRSQDGGQSWTLLSAGLTNPLVETLQFDPAGNLWAGTISGNNGFVAKLNLNERVLRFSTLIGGASNTIIPAVFAGPDGQTMILGRTLSKDLPVTADPVAVLENSSEQGVLAKLDADGGLLEMRMIGLEGMVFGRDKSGRLQVAGSPRSNQAIASGVSVRGSRSGGGNILWSTLDLITGSVVQATWIGGTGVDAATGIHIGQDGLIRLVGTTTSDDFPVVDPIQPKLAGMADGFFLMLRQP